MRWDGAFIRGSDFPMDGGVTSDFTINEKQRQTSISGLTLLF